MEDRLSNSLIEAGYHRVDSNAQGIYLFYLAKEDEIDIISVIHAIRGDELTREQYLHILEQIKANIRQSYPNRLHLLSLIFTAEPNKAKLLCTEAVQDSHWIIDISTNRLMLYENQSRDFTWLQELIEQLLMQEQYPALHNSYEANGRQGMPATRGRRYPAGVPDTRMQFTLLNTIIIAINILAFLITQYTPLFGGNEASLAKGALSWYFIRRHGEYYRLLTSMFLHSGWSHLINNMIVLLFVGSNLERAAGRIKYLVIYFGSGIIAGITSISYNMWKEYGKVFYQNTTISIGASGAIFGVVGAILYIVIINKGRLQEISIPQMVIFVLLSLYSGIVNAHIDQSAHVGGFLAGIVLAILLYRRPARSCRTGANDTAGTDNGSTME